MAASADDPHAERRAEPPDLLSDPAGSDNTYGLALDQQRSIGAMIKGSSCAIDRGAVEAHREIQNAGDRIFGDRKGVRRAPRGRHHDVAGPQIAADKVAGAGLTLVKP